MSSTTAAAIIAVLAGLALAAALVTPYTIWAYRRRGELGFAHALLALGFLIYLMALWTYTLLPLPQETAAWCAANAADQPQLTPFRFVTDIVDNQRGTGLAAFARNPAVQQVVFNVAFFVPLGMFCRHLLRFRIVTTIAAGAVVSLIIEFTQLTGIWFLFQCPYRLFDVDDLIVNTAGAALGVLLAPLLRLVPGQRTSLPAEAPRRVTGWRRLFGMILDVLLTGMLGGVLVVVVEVVVTLVTHGTLASRAQTVSTPVAAALSDWLPAVAFLLLPALIGKGSTPGQAIVRLRPMTASGETPALGRRLARFVAGSGGYFILLGLGTIYSVSFLAGLLAIVTFVMVWTPRDHRGLSGAVAGVRVVDARPTRVE